MIKDYAEINECIKQYKYVHVIGNDKFCVPIIDFFRRNFSTQEHVFLVQHKYAEFPMPDYENTIEIGEMFGLDFSSDSIEKVIMHSLFIKTNFRYWFANQEVQMKKGYWIIYGGDLYDAPRNEIADTVRKGFKGYISDTDGDCDRVREKYELVGKEYYCAAYSFPITMDMIQKALMEKKSEDFTRIQINNSCDKTTLQMLKQLEKYKDENIRITTVVSYAQIEYKDEIIRLGKELFGEKFEYLDKLVEPMEYAKRLAQNDIYILNQDRQQGLGNSIASLVCGVKLFIKSDVTTFHHFMSRGIKIFDTYSIDSLNFDELVDYSKEQQRINIDRAGMFYDDEYLTSCWSKVFEK